jgi:vancomycin resistance protein VanJ
MRRAIGWLPLVHVLGLLLLFVGRAVVPSGKWAEVLALTAELVPWLFLPLPLWVVTALVARTRTAVLLAALPWLAFIWLYGAYFVPPALRGASCDSAPGDRLRVMSFNVLHWNETPDAALALVESEGPDVLAIQELADTAAPAYGRALAPLYPHSRLLPADNALGVGSWTRDPILDARAWEALPRTAHWQHVVVDRAGRRLNVVNLHVTAPDLAWRSNGVPPITGAYPRDRRREVELLIPRLRALLATGEPLVVAGDLNLSDQTPEYRALMDLGLVDAHRAAGWGFGFTFPTSPIARMLGSRVVPPLPAVRIDYVLYGPGLRATSSRVPTVRTGSDHHPVVVDLVRTP